MNRNYLARPHQSPGRAASPSRPRHRLGTATIGSVAAQVGVSGAEGRKWQMVKPAESAVPNLVLSDLRDAQGWSQEEEADRLNDLARAKGLPDTITANAVSR